MKNGELGELAIHLATAIQGGQAELKRQVVVAQRGRNAEVGGSINLGRKEVDAAREALRKIRLVKEGELLVLDKGPKGTLGGMKNENGVGAFREEGLARISDLGELELQREGEGGHDWVGSGWIGADRVWREGGGPVQFFLCCLGKQRKRLGALCFCWFYEFCFVLFCSVHLEG